MKNQVPEYVVKDDKWFQWKGAKAPERKSHGITEDNIDELLAENLKTHQCVYTQRGNDLRCDIGNLIHGKRIPMDKRLSPDYASGEPILVDISYS